MNTVSLLLGFFINIGNGIPIDLPTVDDQYDYMCEIEGFYYFIFRICLRLCLRLR